MQAGKRASGPTPNAPAQARTLNLPPPRLAAPLATLGPVRRAWSSIWARGASAAEGGMWTNARTAPRVP